MERLAVLDEPHAPEHPLAGSAVTTSPTTLVAGIPSASS
jgi:hypothetical protein